MHNARLINSQSTEEDTVEPFCTNIRICSGAILRLHGFASDLSENGGHFTVLIELGSALVGDGVELKPAGSVYTA
jgi:hypothetical protein